MTYDEDPTALAIRKKTSDLVTERYLARQKSAAEKLGSEMSVPPVGAIGHGGYRQLAPQSAVPSTMPKAARFDWKPSVAETATQATTQYEPSPTKMGPSLAGITTQRPFMTSDEEFKRLGGFNQADKQIINARIRERQDSESGTSSAVSPGMARTVDALTGRTTYSGVGAAGGNDDAEMLSRGLTKDRYGNWVSAGGWRSGESHSSGYQAPAEEPDIGSMTIPELMAYGVKNKRAARAQEQAGAQTLAGMREAGALEQTKLAHGVKSPTALESAQARESEARTGMLGTEKAQKEMMLRSSKRDEVAQEIVNNPKDYPTDQVAQARAHLQKKFEEQKMLALIKSGQYEPTTNGMADGGAIRSFANGGAITEPITQTQQVNPAIAQYGQYLTAAAQSGVSPVPFAQYMNLLQTTRSAMNATPSQFADGGDVSALGRPLQGPGTGRSDSIPAIIDGGKPAALSDGEFVIPAHVVKAKGTEFFEKLLAQYAEGAKANG